jgi:non-ribosomal peptide synthetase-like protein
LPVVGGRLLMRGVRPGWYPLWGATYLRYWFYSKIVALLPLDLLAGSPLLPPYLRLLGAKVGRDCYLASALVGLPMLVEIGEGVSIGYGARVQPYFVEGGWLRLAPIRLGSGCFLGTNSIVLAGAEIGSQASVGEQSLVPADHVIPANEHWAGSPIKRLQTVPSLLEAMAARADGRRWPVSVLAGFIVGALLLMLMPFLIVTPDAVIEGVVTVRSGFAWGMVSAALVGPLFVLVTCALVLFIKRALLPVVHAGIYPARSGFGVRKWLSDHMMLMSLVLTHTLYATLYLVPFLRLLGARTGRWSEVAAVFFLDPDMLIDGEQSFVAENTVMAPPVFHRGCIALAPAQVGRRSFVGNGALVPGSCHIADNSLLGVHSVPPARTMDPETTWLGSPAIFLPRRQQSERFPDEMTYSPRPSLIACRLAFEFFRVTLPATILGLSILVGFYVTIQLSAVFSPLALLAFLPVLTLGLGLACTLVVVLLKWMIIGRYRPRAEPLWSVWVRRTELITGLYESVAVPALVNMLMGTPLMAPVLRLFGARIGRRVWLSTTWLTEFDLVEVGDDAAVGEATSLQTHLFEDRVMKMSRVRVGVASSVGSRSIVLYDTEVGSGASLDALSLVMKGESLPPESHWRGIPARPI